METLTKKLKLKSILYIFFASFFTINSYAQVDTAFWFAVPYVNIHHGLEYADNYGGAKPLYFKYSTLNEPATITISQPAYNGGEGRLLKTETLPPNSTGTYTIEEDDKFNIMVSREGDVIEEKGIYIQSTARITVYYENATPQNPDLFALKGNNALGTLFYTPFQTLWPNDPKHNHNHDDPLKEFDWGNSEGDIADGIELTPDSAFSAFDIVATEDRTIIEITPSTDIVGHPKGIPFTKELNKGETYSVRARHQGITDTAVGCCFDHWRCREPNNASCDGLVVEDNKDVDNLSGSKVQVLSGGKIAITLKDDSIFENDEENSYSGGCEDFIGDQLVPVDLVGNEYIVMQGNLDPYNVKEHVFVVATEDGTTVTFTGQGATSNPQVSLDAGETYAYSICDGLNCDAITHIQSDKNIYVLHTSGYNCELAAAVLPPINLCTGSSQVGYTRTYGGAGDDISSPSDDVQRKFFMNLMVRQGEGNVDAFEVYTGGNLDATATNKITSSTFTPLAGTDWEVARISFGYNDMTNGAHLIKNTNTLFHMAFVNSTSVDFSGYTLTGSEYGYFSNYDENIPEAYVFDPRRPNLRRDTLYVDYSNNNGAQYRAAGGVYYTWEDFEFRKKGTDTWVALDVNDLVLSNDDEIAFANSTLIADSGAYRVKVTIKNDCYSEDHGGQQFTDELYVFVEEFRLPNEIIDSVCDTDDDPNVYLSEHYWLNHLADTIMDGLEEKGYYLEGWYDSIPAEDITLADFEGIDLTVSDTRNASATVIANPDTDNNPSSSVLYLLKNDNQGTLPSEQDAYHVDLTLNEPIDLNTGYTFNFKYRYDGNVATNADNHSFSVSLISNDKEIQTEEIAIPAGNITSPKWVDQTIVFNEDTTLSGFTTMRFNFEATMEFNEDHGFYIDDIVKNSKFYFQKIADSNDYVFTKPETFLYSRVLHESNISYDVYARQTFYVDPIGRPTKDKMYDSICRLETDSLCGIDLHQFKYSIGGSITATKDWFRDSLLTDSIENIHNVCAMDCTVFYARINDHCGRIGTVTYNIAPLPEIDSNLSKTVCADKDLVYSAIIDFSQYEDEFTKNDDYPWEFSWYKDAGRTDRYPDKTAITVEDGSTFYGLVNKNGHYECGAYIELYMNVVPAIPDTLDIDDMCLNAGLQDLNLAELGSSIVYTGNGINGNILNPEAAGAGEQEIKLVYTNEIDGKQCNWEYTDTFNIWDIPVIEFDAPDSILMGSIDTITSIVTAGTPSYTYSWTSDPDKQITNSSSGEFVITPPMVEETIDYILEIEDQHICVVIDTHQVKLYGKKLEITISTTPICYGKEASLTANLDGGAGNFEITWKYANGDIIENAQLGNNREHSITLSPNDTTDLVVEVIDHLDFDNLVDIDVTQIVNANPVINVINGETQDICKESIAEINGNVTGGNPAFTHSWTGATDILSETDVAIPDIKTDIDAGEYNLTYIVTDVNNCADTADITISLNELPDFRYEDSLFECQFEVLKAEPNKENTFTIEWSGDDLIQENNNDILTLNTDNPGTFQMNYKLTTEKACSIKDSIFIEIYEKPEASIEASPEFNGDVYTELEIELIGQAIKGTEPYTKGWQDDNLLSIDEDTARFILFSEQDIDFVYDVVDKNGCTAKAIYSRRVKPIGDITTNIPNIVCTDITATYTATASEDYLIWSVEGYDDYTMSTNKGKVVTFEWLSPGTATIIVKADETDPNYKTPFRPDTITIDILPIPKPKIVGDRHVCEYEEREYLLADDYTIDGYDINTEWALIADRIYTNDTYTNETTINIHKDEITPTSDISADVKWAVADIDTVVAYVSHVDLPSCYAMDTHKVYIHKIPEPSFYYEEKPVYIEQFVQFVNTTKEIENLPYRYFWDFIGEDIYTSEDKNPYVDYDMHGDYIAQLTVLDETWGCKATTTDTIIVDPNPDCKILFPNTFFPTKDDYSTFKYTEIKGVMYQKYLLRIYNKWDTKVWETQDRDASWDGYFDGNLQQEGTYVYQCVALCENGEELIITGEVALLR